MQNLHRFKPKEGVRLDQEMTKSLKAKDARTNETYEIFIQIAKATVYNVKGVFPLLHLGATTLHLPNRFSPYRCIGAPLMAN